MPFHVPAWQSQLCVKEKPEELQIVSTCMIYHFALITYKECIKLVAFAYKLRLFLASQKQTQPISIGHESDYV